MEALIDPKTGPLSPPEDIAAEIEEIRRLPDSAGKNMTIEMMQRWLDQQAADV